MINFRFIPEDKFFLFSSYFSLSISRSEYIKKLNSIKSGVLSGHRKNKIVDLKLASSEDWSGLGNESPSVQWHFHTIGRGCGVLLARYSELPEVKDILFCIIDSWAEANRYLNGFANCEQAWAGHTVALRLEFLISVFLILDNEQKIKISDLVLKHINHLIDEENYDGNWNHGLDQSIALLKASYVFGIESATAVARQRILENFAHSFDSQGVNNEQAIMYHNYNIERFAHAEKLMRYFFINVEEFASVLSKARLFLLHAIDPRGNYSLLGDTILTSPIFEHESREIDFVVKQSQEGVRPKQSPKAIYNSGYVFGRSSWDIKDNPSYYSIRFGPARIVHGHNDHTSITYFSDREMVLCDGGFNGYCNDEYREFFRGPQAHNVVYCPNEDKFCWDALTELKFFEQTNHFDAYALEDEPYLDVKRSRVVLFDLAADCFYVYDKVVSKGNREFVQNWNFSSAASLKLHPDFVHIDLKGKGYRLYSVRSGNIEAVKAYSTLKNGRPFVVGGFLGVGHNQKKENYNVRVKQRGEIISWRSFFCADNNAVKFLHDDSVILNDKIYYSIFVECDNYCIQKKALSPLPACNTFLFPVESKLDYIKGERAFWISNETGEKQFFLVDLSALIENGNYRELLIDFKIDVIEGNQPTYFYANPHRNKLRFGTGAICEFNSTRAIARIPVDPMTKIEVEPVFQELTEIRTLQFSIGDEK